MEHLTGKTGFIRPSFDEYINRYKEVDSIYYIPDNRDYSYNVNDVMGYFNNKMLDNLVIINLVNFTTHGLQENTANKLSKV